MTLNIDLPDFKISDTHPLWGGAKLYDLYNGAHMPWNWHHELFNICNERNVIPFSSPFDSTAVDLLEGLNCKMYKIASMESGDIPLITKVMNTNKPVIVSTGASTIDEIDDVVEVFKNRKENLTLLVCTSSYPALPVDAHLLRIGTLRERYGVKVGISDHTLGLGVSLAAVGLGATMVEKHITLDRKLGGPDSAFSMEPLEFKQLATEIKSARESLGSKEWGIQKAEDESRRLRRSLYIVKNVKIGDVLTSENIRAIRPGFGLKPKHLNEVLGKKFNRDLVAGTPLSFEIIN
jgi:N-acetylneuraminate synthase